MSDRIKLAEIKPGMLAYLPGGMCDVRKIVEVTEVGLPKYGYKVPGRSPTGKYVRVRTVETMDSEYSVERPRWRPEQHEYYSQVVYFTQLRCVSSGRDALAPVVAKWEARLESKGETTMAAVALSELIGLEITPRQMRLFTSRELAAIAKL